MAGESALSVVLRQRGPDEHALESRRAVVEALASLPEKQWRVFHDVPWPGRRFGSIDHVVIGPPGMFVVHAPTWPGEIDTRSGGLRQDGRSRGRAVTAVSLAAEALTEQVSALTTLVTPAVVVPMICVVRPEPVFGWASEVLVCSTPNLTRMLNARPAALSEREVHAVAGALTRSLTPGALPRPLTRPPRRLPSVRVVAGITALVALVLLVLRFDGVGRLSDLGDEVIARTGQQPTVVAGQSVSLPGAAGRPALELTASAPVATVPATPGARLPLKDRLRPGHRLLAVTLTVRNRGTTRWVQRAGTSVVLHDRSGAAYPTAAAVRAVRGGTLLPGALRLRPGQSVRGMLVFDVPGSASIDRVQMTVGPEDPRTLRWAVDPQR